MTRQGLLLGSVIALLLPACGGSSSETPPPLEPDPHGFHYLSAPATRAESADAGTPPPSHSLLDDDDEVRPKKPANSTWGSPTPKAK